MAAYCRTNTCEAEPDNPACDYDPVTSCLGGGEPLFWSGSCISFSIHGAASPLRGISYEEASATISEAMSLWANATCAGAGCTPSKAVNSALSSSRS